MPKSIVGPDYYGKDIPWTARTMGTETNQKERLLRCRIPFGFGYELVGFSLVSKPDTFYVDFVQDMTNPPLMRENPWFTLYTDNLIDVDPFIGFEITSGFYQRMHNVQVRRGVWPHEKLVMEEQVSAYGTWEGNKHTDIPYQHVKLRVFLIDDPSVSEEIEFRMVRPESGTLTPQKNYHGKVILDFGGQNSSWVLNLKEFDAFHRALSRYTVEGGLEAMWTWWLADTDPSKRPMGGIKALAAKKHIAPVLERLEAEEPTLWRFFAWLHDESTQDKTTNNKLLAAMLEAVGDDFDKLRGEIRRVMLAVQNISAQTYPGYHFAPPKRDICLTFVGAGDKVAAQKAKEQWQFAQGAKAQSEVLGISADQHPRLLARVESGSVPLTLFHEAGEKDKLINVEFDLIERAFNRDGWEDVLIEIMQNASARTTYSKRVTNYIAFLYRIERYLDRHAPRPDGSKWKAMPKFVQSQWDLEMGEASEEGTTKRRSAFTPVADNEAGTITVPYIAMSISGVRTTWCYSEIYFVAEEGAEDPVFEAGGVYEHELATKLNGRDDYGLCLFTLTGTDRNTGYPTFLVIFERTSKHGTRVHFHRVHPSRKRGPNGTETPPNRLIEECYRYMAGNIRAEEIAYQQGDLLLVKAVGPGKATEEPVPVYGFENHSFVGVEHDGGREIVKLVKSSAKSRDNLLGWLHAPTGMRMPHPEHEPVEDIAPGWYELRRCKSWEANPTSVWVLNID